MGAVGDTPIDGAGYYTPTFVVGDPDAAAGGLDSPTDTGVGNSDSPTRVVVGESAIDEGGCAPTPVKGEPTGAGDDAHSPTYGGAGGHVGEQAPTPARTSLA